MTGIGQILNIAKDAINVQQYSLNVVAHNIANVNTPSYSRQHVEHTTATPYKINGQVIGMGVDIDSVKRNVDQLLEDRLTATRSELAAYGESSEYLRILESIFNEVTTGGVADLMTEFWNSWQDLSINPAGTTERAIVYEKGVQISDRFESLSGELSTIQTDLTNRIDAAVTEINTIAGEIAELNQMILGFEGGLSANDLYDKRNALVNELAEYINVDTFEQTSGALTVMVGGGNVVVSDTATYTLSLSSGQVMWDGAGNSNLDITDDISSGKIGGWLDIRDDIIDTYSNDLDALVKEFAWQVNQQHSQGVGLTYFTGAITGTHATDASGLLATLDYGNKIDYTQDFKIWIKDDSGTTPTYTSVTVDLSGGAVDAFDNVTLSGTANSVLDTYKVTVSPAGGDIGNGSAATLTWSNSVTQGTVSIAATDTTATIDGITLTLTAPGDGPFPSDTFTITTDANGTPTANERDYTHNDFVTAYNTAAAAAGLTVGTDAVTVSVVNDTLRFTPDNSDISFAFSDDAFSDSGLAAAFGVNTFFEGSDAATISVNSVLANTNYIAAAKVDGSNGYYAAGDNSNALDMAALQSTNFNVAQWNYIRGSAETSSTVSATIEGHYHSMISALGVESVSFSHTYEFKQTMANKLGEQRDQISAVSLDEEMVDMIKYQHAYTVAAKLLTVADEMLSMLVSQR